MSQKLNSAAPQLGLASLSRGGRELSPSDCKVAGYAALGSVSPSESSNNCCLATSSIKKLDCIVINKKKLYIFSDSISIKKIFCHGSITVNISWYQGADLIHNYVSE